MSRASGRLLRALYNGLAVPVARLALPVGARANPKLRQGIEARRGLTERWRVAAARTAGRTPRIWLHAASAGEALQAGPLAKAIRRDRPEAAIFFSWFSPSAEGARRASVFDHADYLPLDHARAMRRLVELLAPDAIVLVGAETWPNLVWSAADGDVRLGQACCRLAGSARLRWLARPLTRDLYRHFAAVAVVAPEDAVELRSLGVSKDSIGVAGDTRVDVTLERVAEAAELPPPWQPPGDAGPVVLAGSTHPADEAIVLETVALLRRDRPRLVAVVAPHEPSKEALARLEHRARAGGLEATRLGELAPGAAPAVVLVDRVGILYRLYALADLAYVGGGFGGAVHNTMEPAAWRVPVAIGPDHGGPHEVQTMSRAGGLAVVGSTSDLLGLWSRWLDEPARRDEAGAAARAALDDAAGATERTLAFLRARGLPV